MGWLIWVWRAALALFKAWANRTPSEVAEAEKAGGAEQEVKQEQADAADVQKAVQAADSSRAATALPGSLRAPGDPDCRDCEV